MDRRTRHMETMVRKNLRRSRWLAAGTFVLVLCASAICIVVILTLAPQDNVDHIARLKSAVLETAQDLDGLDLQAVRDGVRCDQYTDFAECKAAADAAEVAWQEKTTKFQLLRTQLAVYGVEFDEATQSFKDSTSKDSRKDRAEADHRNLILDAIKIAVAPIVLAVFAWIGRIWLHQIARYQAVLIVLSGIETDRELKRSLLENGALLEHLRLS